ncbi:hypothetical protein [Streptomyces sp. 7N604]|uniref:hypothetical protein n=1 Tax=Streptomyces sp. 7N604 TaxID=3457415 RepID=UPI003FD686DF
MNLLVLILVPVVFVVVAAEPMADAAELLGGPGGPAVQTATAGWAAGSSPRSPCTSRCALPARSTAAWSWPGWRPPGW